MDKLGKPVSGLKRKNEGSATKRETRRLRFKGQRYRWFPTGSHEPRDQKESAREETNGKAKTGFPLAQKIQSSGLSSDRLRQPDNL
jgi:hypothetical protein